MITPKDLDMEPLLIITQEDFKKAVNHTLFENDFTMVSDKHEFFEKMSEIISREDYTKLSDTYLELCMLRMPVFYAGKKTNGKETYYHVRFAAYFRKEFVFRQFYINVALNGKVTLVSLKETDLFEEAYELSGMKKKYGDYTIRRML
jgi:hypothetical protein